MQNVLRLETQDVDIVRFFLAGFVSFQSSWYKYELSAWRGV